MYQEIFRPLLLKGTLIYTCICEGRWSKQPKNYKVKLKGSIYTLYNEWCGIDELLLFNVWLLQTCIRYTDESKIGIYSAWITKLF